VLARTVRELAAKAPKPGAAAPVEPDAPAVARLCRRLTAAQRRMIAEIDPLKPFNAVRAAPRLSSVRCVSEIGLIERGRCGWADAKLTKLGRAVQARIQKKDCCG
jgi:hypothetical protein